MKRPQRFLVTTGLALGALMASATPALAQYDDAAGAGFSLFFCGCWAFWIILLIVGFIFWLWMFIDFFKRTDQEIEAVGQNKTTWMILMLVGLFIFPLGAALLYYFIVYKKIQALPAGSVPAPPRAGGPPPGGGTPPPPAGGSTPPPPPPSGGTPPPPPPQ